MNDRNTEKKQPAVSGEPESVVQLLIAMADTTWRMFTPPALLVPGGIYGDLRFQTKPWLTIVEAVVGLGLSVLLVRQQLRGSR
jgi:hypothetical protein